MDLPLCTSCRQPLHLHSKSGRALREAANGIAVRNGRCHPGGEPARQKLSWVAMSEPLTEEEYRKRYSAASPPPMEPCPQCGSRLGYHGHFARQMAEGGRLEPLLLFRGICRNPACPVVTVTHYPPFVTPYSVFPTAARESAIVASLAKGLETAAAETGCSARTVLRWRKALRERLGELVSGIAGLIMRLDPLWPLPRLEGPGTCFLLLARARTLSFAKAMPLLAVARQRPPWPSALPVFA